MIKLKIERHRDFTPEETEVREKWRRERFGMNDSMSGFTQAGRDVYIENAMDVEITNEQFEAIRKAVLENF